VQHPILGQQRGAPIQQFIEDLDVRNPRVLACQKYELDGPFAEAAAELRHQRGLASDAFVNDDPFDAFHDKCRRGLLWPSRCT